MFHVLAEDAHASAGTHGHRQKKKNKKKQHANGLDTSFEEPSDINGGLSEADALTMALQQSTVHDNAGGDHVASSSQSAHDTDRGDSTSSSIVRDNGHTTPKPTGFVGLLNQGATCYLNSLLQSLFMLPEVRWGLYQLGPSDLFMTADGSQAANTTKKPRWMVLRLQQLFASLQYGARASVGSTRPPQALSTRAVTDSFGWKDNDQAYQQHDVSELNRILIDVIQQSLEDTRGRSLVADTFCGETVVRMTCDECDYSSEKVERVYDLTLPVQGLASLEKSLSQYFSEERLEGDNKWRCGGCGQKVDATRTVKFRCLPPVLTFCLLRFSFNWETNQRVKVNDPFPFPLQLDMSAHTDAAGGVKRKTSGKVQPNELRIDDVFQYSESPIYELASVVVHRGGAHQGHYHAFIRDFMGECEWSTELARIAQKQAAQTDQAGLAAVFPGLSGIAHHHRESKGSHPLVPVFTSLLRDHGTVRMDQLGDLFFKKQGESWNKTYKPKLGTLSRFLNRFPEAFVVKNAEVSLTAKAKKPQSKPKAAPNESSEQKQSKQTPPEKPITELHPGWFHFNDESVSPVFSKRLEEVFGGKSECAYMLTYRRRVEDRKSGDRAVFPPVPPDHVVKSLEQEETKAAAREQQRLDALSQVRVQFTQLRHVHTNWPLSDQRDKSRGDMHGHANWTTVVARTPYVRVVDSRLTVLELQELLAPALFLPKQFPANTFTDADTKHARAVRPRDRLIFTLDNGQPLTELGKTLKEYHFHDGCEVFVEGLELDDASPESPSPSTEELQEQLILATSAPRVTLASKEIALRAANKLARVQVAVPSAVASAAPGTAWSTDESLAQDKTKTSEAADRVILSWFMPETWMAALTVGWLRDATVQALPAVASAADNTDDSEASAIDADVEESEQDEVDSDDDPEDEMKLSVAGSMGRVLLTTGELLADLSMPLAAAVSPGGVLMFDPVPMPEIDELVLRISCVKRGKPIDSVETQVTLSVHQTVGEAKVLLASALGLAADQVILRRSLRGRKGQVTAGDFLLHEDESISSLEPHMTHGEVVYVELEEKPKGSVAAAAASAEQAAASQVRVRLHLLTSLDDPQFKPNFRTPSESPDSPAVAEDPYAIPKTCFKPLLSRSCDSSKTTVYDIKTALIKAALAVRAGDVAPAGSSSGFNVEGAKLLQGTTVETRQLLIEALADLKNHTFLRLYRLEPASLQPRAVFKSLNVDLRALRVREDVDIGVQVLSFSEQLSPRARVLFVFRRILDASAGSGGFGLHRRITTHVHLPQEANNFAQFLSKFADTVGIPCPKLRLALYNSEVCLWRELSQGGAKQRKKDRGGKKLLASIIKSGSCAHMSFISTDDIAHHKEQAEADSAVVETTPQQKSNDLWNTPYDVWLAAHVKATRKTRSGSPLGLNRQLSAGGALTIELEL